MSRKGIEVVGTFTGKFDSRVNAVEVLYNLIHLFFTMDPNLKNATNLPKP